MRDKEILDSGEAAALLGCEPSTIHTLARQGAIPGKKLGKEWRFVRRDLLAWMRSGGIADQGRALEPTASDAAAFLQRAHKDNEFRQKLESFATDQERMAFVRQEGFVFTLVELEEAVKAKLPEVHPQEHQKPPDAGQERRKAKRYQVYLKVSELNGQPVDETMILDISAWGARIGSMIPFDAPGVIEITFAPPGETKNVRLAGKVIWSRLMPSSGQYQAGVQFSKPIHQLHREGKI
jgi:predicted ribosomally synthesized peptide with nif11-like leader